MEQDSYPGIRSNSHQASAIYCTRTSTISCEPTAAFLCVLFRNAFGQTSLHVACNVARQKSPNALDRRAYSVILLLRDAGRASDSRG